MELQTPGPPPRSACRADPPRPRRMTPHPPRASEDPRRRGWPGVLARRAGAREKIALNSCTAERCWCSVRWAKGQGPLSLALVLMGAGCLSREALTKRHMHHPPKDLRDEARVLTLALGLRADRAGGTELHLPV